jgi:hypothetical protein
MLRRKKNIKNKLFCAGKGGVDDEQERWLA